MNDKLARAEDIFLDKINRICSKFGLNNIMAQLYAILYVSKNTLSLNDMVEKLKISKGSASVNIRALERYGAVRKIWIKGSRRDYYEAETNISKVAMDRIKSMARSRLSELDDMINTSYETLNSVNSADREEKEAIKVFRERLGELKSLQRKALSLFELLNSGLLSNVLKIKSAEADEKEALTIGG